MSSFALYLLYERRERVGLVTVSYTIGLVVLVGGQYQLEEKQTSAGAGYMNETQYRPQK